MVIGRDDSGFGAMGWMRESKPIRLVVEFSMGANPPPERLKGILMTEMRPITYKDLTPAKAVYAENEELRRLITVLQGQMNALRSDYVGLKTRLAQLEIRNHAE